MTYRDIATGEHCRPDYELVLQKDGRKYRIIETDPQRDWARVLYIFSK